MNKIINNYEILEIKKIISETDTIKTFIFIGKWKKVESQFQDNLLCLNFLGKSDEKPMSISIIDKRE